MDTLIVIRKIKVENANCIAGLTWGFPAISHFLGFTHALSRKLPVDWRVELNGCGVICHNHQIQAHQPRGWGDHVFSLTRNPLDEDGESPSFVEEGRMHMTVSLVIICQGEIKVATKKEEEERTKILRTLIFAQRLAGGTIIGLEGVEIYNPPEDMEGLEKFERKQLRKLLPGFALVQRSELLAQHTQNCKQDNPDIGPLQPWLDFSAIKSKAEEPAQDQKNVAWERIPKPDRGWLVPLAVGYRSISDLYEPGQISCSRDPQYPFSFVETVYSIGEWIAPPRVVELGQLIWRQRAIPTAGWYLCENLYNPKKFNN